MICPYGLSIDLVLKLGLFSLRCGVQSHKPRGPPEALGIQQWGAQLLARQNNVTFIHCWMYSCLTCLSWLFGLKLTVAVEIQPVFGFWIRKLGASGRATGLSPSIGRAKFDAHRAEPWRKRVEKGPALWFTGTRKLLWIYVLYIRYLVDLVVFIFAAVKGREKARAPKKRSASCEFEQILWLHYLGRFWLDWNNDYRIESTFYWAISCWPLEIDQEYKGQRTSAWSITVISCEGACDATWSEKLRRRLNENRNRQRKLRSEGIETARCSRGFCIPCV